MSVSALAASRLASPSVSGVGAARPLYYKNLSNAGIAALTASEIGAMQSVEMAALSGSQIKAFNPAALASGLPIYLNNKQVLTANFISNLGNNQISQFGSPLVNATLLKMSVTQIGAIHTSAISGIGAAALQSLSGAQLSGFTQAQVRSLSAPQIASLGSQKTAALPAAWVNKLSSEQLQGLGTGFAKALTKTQIAGLDTDHVQYLSSAQVASLTKVQLGVLSRDQIQAIDAPDISSMTTAQFAALSKTQLQALRVEQIAEVNGANARAISAKNIASMSYQQISAFTTRVVANLGGNQLAAMTREQISMGLDAAKIAALSANQVRYFSARQISALTNPEVAAISLSTMKTLYDPHLRAFTVDQLSQLSKEKIDWIVDKKLQITGFSAQQKDAILARKLAVENNSPPTLAQPIADQIATEGVAFAFTLPTNTFADVDIGDMLSYTAARADGSTLPSWLQFNANSRTFSGIPGNGDSGEFNLRVTARDLAGASVNSAFKIAVANVNNAPTGSVTITGTPRQGNVLVASNSLRDDDGLGTISYQWLANGSNISGATNSTLTLSQALVGKAIRVKASYTDLLGTAEGVTSAATALVANTNDAPTVAHSIADQNATAGVAFVFTVPLITFADVDGGETLSYMATRADGSDLPSWLQFNPNTRTFSGTPGNTDSGSLNLKVTARDWAGASVNDVFRISVGTSSAAPTKVWTKLLEAESGDQYGGGMTTGTDGAIYVTGTTNGVMGGQTLIGYYDQFLTKLSPDGTQEWTRLFGSLNYDNGGGITTGLDGSIYVSGTVGANIDGQINSGLEDVCVTKFNSDGTKEWTRLLGTSSTDYAWGLTTGADGSILLSGLTSGPLDGQTNDGEDFFIAKFNPDGTKEWTQLIGSDGMENGFTFGPDGSIYISGTTGVSMDGQTNSGERDAFITKFKPDGEKEWTRLLGSTSREDGYGITTGADGALYVCGYTVSSSLDGQTVLGRGDAFIAKFSPEGNKEWTRLLHEATTGSESAGAYGIITGADGSIYISGFITRPLDGEINIPNQDGFIAKFNPDGTKEWTQVIGTRQDDVAGGMMMGADGSLYLSGYTKGNLDGQTNQDNRSKVFIIKYST